MSKTDAMILSLPNLSDTSFNIRALLSLERFKATLWQPAYKSFFTSSTRLTFPAALTGTWEIWQISLIFPMASSCSSSVEDRSKTSSPSAPLSL